MLTRIEKTNVCHTPCLGLGRVHDDRHARIDNHRPVQRQIALGVQVLVQDRLVGRNPKAPSFYVFRVLL
jgi:hypothetical protein